MEKQKKFMYGIGAVRFGSKVIGYIEKGSWDWGGKKPETVDVEAEQVPTAPVLTLVTKNGTIAPTFNLIQLDYENLHLALGGTLVGTSGAYTGWESPVDLVELRDECEIDLVSGQTVVIPAATLTANLGGKLTLTEVSKLECQLTANMPLDGKKPYSVQDTDTYKKTNVKSSDGNPVAVAPAAASEGDGASDPEAEGSKATTTATTSTKK